MEDKETVFIPTQQHSHTQLIKKKNLEERDRRACSLNKSIQKSLI